MEWAINVVYRVPRERGKEIAWRHQKVMLV